MTKGKKKKAEKKKAEPQRKQAKASEKEQIKAGETEEIKASEKEPHGLVIGGRVLVPGGPNFNVTDKGALDTILKSRFSDLPPNFSSIALRKPFRILQHPSIFQDLTVVRLPDKSLKALLNIRCAYKDFIASFSLLQYSEQFQELSNAKGVECVLGHRDSLVLLHFPVVSTQVTIIKQLKQWQHFVREIDRKTMAALASKASTDSVSVFFNLPEEIKVPCEQYLQYFAQFLKDMGVNASTSLVNEAGEVLFTVTPTDHKEALDKIREALDVYLKLPYSPMSDSLNESIEILRLKNQVHRFRGDVELRAAELEQKNATIRAQNVIIELQEKYLRAIDPKIRKGGVGTIIDTERVDHGLVRFEADENDSVESAFQRVRKMFADTHVDQKKPDLESDES